MKRIDGCCDLIHFMIVDPRKELKLLSFSRDLRSWSFLRAVDMLSLYSLCFFQTVADKQKDDSYRHSSLEVMVSLCESATNMVKKKASNFIPTLCKR